MTDDSSMLQSDLDPQSEPHHSDSFYADLHEESKKVLFEKIVELDEQKRRYKITSDDGDGSAPDGEGSDDTSISTLDPSVRDDRFGFAIYDPQPPISFSYLFADPPPHPPRDTERERRRINKWTEMVDNWSSYRGTSTLKARVRKGIPEHHRCQVWQLLLNSIDLVRTNELSGRSVFSELLAKEAVPAHVTQIAKDIDRTFPHAVFFRSSDHSGAKTLFRLLKAYSCHNEEVGYCQGMGFPAAVLLLYMQERQAYWSFYRMMRGMGDMYTTDLRGVRVRCKALELLLLEVEPVIAKHLTKVGIDMSMVAVNWFMTCFSYSMDFSVAVRLFDICIAEGEKIVYRAAIALLKRAADGVMIPTPPKRLLKKALRDTKSALKWPWPMESVVYQQWFCKWAAKPENKGKMSLLSMPTEQTLSYLQHLPGFVRDPDSFIEECLKVKFSSATLAKVIRKAESIIS
eukprot:gnl/Dysnectes_brevis/3451_a4371_923.p1 GENE.gnl/Dysnectes_brevis/3451_a4371_923~~gnl/Dysnectes_brevis/3451_a4371_923.p1  ORF type:complete len:458 (+),score=118.38 gnl/Dysnectes_brevis/3451_a4371_923:66-1439(+)